MRLVSNLIRHANPPHLTSSSKTLAGSAKASTSRQFRSGLVLVELVGVVSRTHDSIGRLMKGFREIAFCTHRANLGTAGTRPERKF